MATILIAGGTGLIGQRLSELLANQGHEVRLLSRRSKVDSKFKVFTWDVGKGNIENGALDNVDYVINLAGAGIADKRWSKSRKQLIIDSRVNAAETIKSHLTNHPTIKAYLGASAIGYYGNRSNEWMNEKSDPGEGFLSTSTQAWEAATASIADLGIRTITLRIGIVLSTKGGALQKMLMPFKLGLGNYFGNGQQYYSWVHIDDIAGSIEHLLFDNQKSGIYNAVAPSPTTNKEFARAIKRSIFPWSMVLPAPAFGLRLALGEMSAVVLDSTRVSGKKISDSGYQFKFDKLEEALKDVYEKKI